MKDPQLKLKLDTLVQLIRQQIELQEQLLITLRSHHEDARKMWEMD